MAERYVSDLFTGRVVSLRDTLAWANNPNPTQRLRSIVGAPGIGKSYLLNRIRDELSGRADRLVLWIDVNRNVVIRGPTDVLAPSGLETWLRDAVQRARTLCDRVHVYDGNIRPEAMLDKLVSDFCERCAQILMPILIVDSFDDVPLGRQDEFEERILVPFISRSCTRILLSRRDDYGLISLALRWNEEKDMLPSMTSTEGNEQLDRRLAFTQQRPESSALQNDVLDHLKRSVPKYPWNHPGINTFLFERVIARQRQGQVSFLVADDLRECVLEITRGSEPLTAEVFVFLALLANDLDVEWTENELQKALLPDGINMEDKRMTALFTRGIVFNVEGTSRYKVSDGLRDLLRAWQVMRATKAGGQA